MMDQENAWEKFEFLSKHSTDRRKWLEDFIRILEDKANYDEQYAKNLEKIINLAESLSPKGTLQTMVHSFKLSQKLKLSSIQSSFQSLRKEVVEFMKNLLKTQNNDGKNFTNEGKKLDKDCKNLIEKVEKLKSTYAQHSKECDNMGIDKENMILNKTLSQEKRNKLAQKYEEMKKNQRENEKNYHSKCIEYNNFLDKFQIDLDNLNQNFIKQEKDREDSIKYAIGRAIELDVINLSNYLSQVHIAAREVEICDNHKEFDAILSQIKYSKNFYPKISPFVYSSYFEHGIQDMQTKQSERDEAIIESFRKFYAKLIGEEKPDRTIPFEHEKLNETEKTYLTFLAHFSDGCWKGERFTRESLKYFKSCLSERLFKRALVVALQQYRISGKFILNDQGYANITELINNTLHHSVECRDPSVPRKILILSLTFWKVLKKNQNQEEKKFIQSQIYWHKIWKEIDFWVMAVLMSIIEEINHQKALNLEESETPEETLDRVKNIVFGHLATFAKNMSCFRVEKSDMKKIIKQFSQYYNLDDQKQKDLLQNVESSSKMNETLQLQAMFAKESEDPVSGNNFTAKEDFFDVFFNRKETSDQNRKESIDKDPVKEDLNLKEEFKADSLEKQPLVESITQEETKDDTEDSSKTTIENTKLETENEPKIQAQDQEKSESDNNNI